MKRKSFFIGSGVVLGLFAISSAFSYFLTKKLVNMALDRSEQEKSSEYTQEISGSSYEKELLEMRKIMAEKLENDSCETVEIMAHDGEKLVGHWHKCENAKRILIAVHGWRSSWARGFGIIADFFNQNNCDVLYIEQRGQNNSGGAYMGFGLIERYDCLDWINWINEKSQDKLPIYLCGISMGASTVLMAAGLDLPENVHGIIADCGYTSPHAIWKYVAENNLYIRYDYIRGEIANDLCREKINIGSKDYSCVEALKKCSVPVLFIHGTDDHFVPIEMTYENYKACAAPKRLFVVPGAEHGMSYIIDREGYERNVKEFWKDFDIS